MLKRILLALALAACVAAPATRAWAQEENPSRSAADRTHHPAGETAGGEEKQPPLLPELNNPQTYWGAAWVVIIFVVLLMILYPTAWRQVLNGLKAREQRIRTDIAEAEAARVRAEQTLKDYNGRLAAAEERVRELIAKATADGERLASQIRAHAQQEAEETKERALRDIETARSQAVAEIYQQTAVLATSVAEKILRRNLNPDDQRDLVNGSLEQIQAVGRA